MLSRICDVAFMMLLWINLENLEFNENEVQLKDIFT